MRAKFVCQSVIDYGNAKAATLKAVTGSEGENMDFNKYTPEGTLDIHICNPDAFDYFKPNKDYYLDFSEAD